LAQASVFRKLSIEDNILSVLQLTKLSKEEQVAKMESLIAEFSLNTSVQIAVIYFLEENVVLEIAMPSYRP
jgi:ABC-type lipopolysaccharide export system ATPase subunit